MFYHTVIPKSYTEKVPNSCPGSGMPKMEHPMLSTIEAWCGLDGPGQLSA